MNDSKFSQTAMSFLKEKRESLGITQTEVAIYIYGDKKYRGEISKLESNKRNITLFILDKYLEFFKCEITFKEN
jgi:transcriptional regulator with XRE-family HTH domain